MNYFLDTNIILTYLRANDKRQLIENLYDPFGSGNIPIISVL